MNIGEMEYLQLEANAEAPVIALASLLCKIYEENFAKDTDNKFLNQRATRFILAILSKREGLTQNDIARVSHLTGATISTTLGALENDGMIERIPDRYDHRSVRVYLTKKGRELNQAREDIVSVLEKEGRRNITPKELRDTIYVLSNYIQNLLTKKKMEL